MPRLPPQATTHSDTDVHGNHCVTQQEQEQEQHDLPASQAANAHTDLLLSTLSDGQGNPPPIGFISPSVVSDQRTGESTRDQNGHTRSRPADAESCIPSFRPAGQDAIEYGVCTDFLYDPPPPSPPPPPPPHENVDSQNLDLQPQAQQDTQSLSATAMEQEAERRLIQRLLGRDSLSHTAAATDRQSAGVAVGQKRKRGSQYGGNLSTTTTPPSCPSGSGPDQIVRSPYFSRETSVQRSPSPSRRDSRNWDLDATPPDSPRSNQPAQKRPRVGTPPEVRANSVDFDFHQIHDPDPHGVVGRNNSGGGTSYPNSVQGGNGDPIADAFYAGLHEVSTDCCAGFPGCFTGEERVENPSVSSSSFPFRGVAGEQTQYVITRPEDAQNWCFGCQWGAEGHRPVDNIKIRRLAKQFMTLILRGNTSLENIGRIISHMYRVTIRDPARKLGQWLPDWPPQIVQRHIENMTEPRVVNSLLLRKNLLITRRLFNHTFSVDTETGQEVPLLQAIRVFNQCQKQIMDLYKLVPKESFGYNEDLMGEDWGGGVLIHPSRVARPTEQSRYPGAPIASDPNQAGVRQAAVTATGEDSGALRGPANDEELVRRI